MKRLLITIINLKLDFTKNLIKIILLVTIGSSSSNDVKISRLTVGVAVAVKAINGTSFSIRLIEPIFLYEDLKSFPHWISYS